MSVNKRNTSEQCANNRKLVSFFSLLLIVFAARMEFVFDIGFFYVIIFSSLIITVGVYIDATKNVRRRLVGLFLFSVFLWIVQSELIKYRHSPLVPYAPTGLASIFPGLIMGYVFVGYYNNTRLLKTTMYCILAYFFLFVVILRDHTFLMNLSEKTSSVGILVLTFALIIPVMYLEYRDERKISLLPLLMQLVISFFLESRAGLGACVVLVGLALLVGAHSIQQKGRRYSAYFLIGAVAVVVITTVLANMASYAGVAKTMDQGVDLTGRAVIWANYFAGFSFRDLIFGKDIIGINDGDWQNAHNSWIQLHSAVGLIGVIIMVVYLRILIYNIKHDLLLAAIMFVMVFFSFFNKVYFFSAFDWCVYIFYFDYLRKRNLSMQEKPQIKMSFT